MKPDTTVLIVRNSCVQYVNIGAGNGLVPSGNNQCWHNWSIFNKKENGPKVYLYTYFHE